MLNGDIYYLIEGSIVDFMSQFPSTAMRYLGPGLKQYAITKTVTRYLRDVGAWPAATPKLRELGLPDTILNRRVCSLTLGQRGKVAIARAITSAPELLVVDTPEAFLDYDGIRWLVAELKSYVGTIILTTNDCSLAKYLATCVVIMRAGRTSYYAGAEMIDAIDSITYPKFLYPKTPAAGGVLVSMRDCEFSHFDCLRVDTMDVLPDSRIAIFGPRLQIGALMAAVLMEAHQLGGDVAYAENLTTGVHSINEMLNMPHGMRAVDYVSRSAKCEKYIAMDALTALGLTHTECYQAIADGTLSVKSRVLLAELMTRRPRLIVLDNPARYLTAPQVLTLCDFINSAPCAVMTTTPCSEIIYRCNFAVYTLDTCRLIDKTEPGCYDCWHSEGPVDRN